MHLAYLKKTFCRWKILLNNGVTIFGMFVLNLVSVVTSPYPLRVVLISLCERELMVFLQVVWVNCVLFLLPAYYLMTCLPIGVSNFNDPGLHRKLSGGFV